MSDGLMMIALETAVPLWIERLRREDFAERQRLGILDADVIASSDTVIEYKPPSKADIRPAVSFNAVARGLAMGALLPLGVTFSGRHWCTDHDLCIRAEASALARSPNQDRTGQ